MALEANAYVRSNATTDGVVPNLYDEVAEKYLYEAEVLRPLCLDKSGMILNKPGKSFQMFLETQFSVSALTEGTSTPVSALDFNDVTLTVAWYGDAKQISKENLSEVFDFVWGDLQFGASGALAENRDAQIMTEMLNTTVGALYPYSSGKTKYTSSTIVAAGVLSYEEIVDAETYFRTKRLKGKAIVIHPNQMADLLKDSKFIEVQKGGKTVLYNGQIGEIRNMAVIVSTAVTTATENSTTVYKAIAVADRAVLYAQKVAPVFEFDEETKRARSITFHYYEAFGAKILRTDGVLIVKSA